MIEISEIVITEQDAISFELMKRIDYHSIEKYNLPISLMMENAGYHLARIAATYASKKQVILIGIGKGNNGGGGLVAARRLLAWGYQIYLDLPSDDLNHLAQQQLQRALAFGAKIDSQVIPDVFIDAYFGFSQRWPLPDIYLKRIKALNHLNPLILSLDVPSGLAESATFKSVYIKPDIIVSLAHPKTVLYRPELAKSNVFLVDIGIPKEAFKDFGLHKLVPFEKAGIFELIR